MSHRVLILCLSAAVVGTALGLGGATRTASAGSARSAERPRTLFAGSREIYAFALGAHRITWISRAHIRGRFGCAMHVRTLRGGRTLLAPLPKSGCGSPPSSPDWVPQTPVLVSGMAAWVTRSGCGISECFWEIAAIKGGQAKARVVDNVGAGCPGVPACLFPRRAGRAASAVTRPYPRSALAGNGNLLVFSTFDSVRRIVGGHTVPFALPPPLGAVESLAVGGGAVEIGSTVLNVGDGCGCLYSPAWSPDGSQIAYLHVMPNGETSGFGVPTGTPAVMNADGSARHDLSLPQAANEGPVWSPDGKQIAYGENSSTSPPEKIVVANADGSGAHEIGSGYDPAWSPDGSKIAFTSLACGGPTTVAISVMNPDGTNVQQLASLTGSACLPADGMAWSPDGTRIAFSLGGTLEVMNADGSNPHPLGSPTLGDEPSWSPDGSQLVFHDPHQNGLAVIGADGSNLRRLTGGLDSHPSWSPDGKTIVFSSDRNNPYDYYGFPELYLVDPDGSNLRPLSFTKPTVFENQETFYSANGTPLPSLPGVPTLAGNVAAVGSKNPSGDHEITLFDATTGVQLAAVNVGGKLAYTFDIAGADSDWVVFHLDRTIFGLNVTSHQVVRLTRASAYPVGLSVSGRRVAWAENTNFHGRIRTFELPN